MRGESQNDHCRREPHAARTAESSGEDSHQRILDGEAPLSIKSPAHNSLSNPQLHPSTFRQTCLTFYDRTYLPRLKFFNRICYPRLKIFDRTHSPRSIERKISSGNTGRTGVTRPRHGRTIAFENLRSHLLTAFEIFQSHLLPALKFF